MYNKFIISFFQFLFLFSISEIAISKISFFHYWQRILWTIFLLWNERYYLLEINIFKIYFFHEIETIFFSFKFQLFYLYIWKINWDLVRTGLLSFTMLFLVCVIQPPFLVHYWLTNFLANTSEFGFNFLKWFLLSLLPIIYFSFHRTIFWISLIYVLGHALKTAAAIPLFYEAGFDQV